MIENNSEKIDQDMLSLIDEQLHKIDQDALNAMKNGTISSHTPVSKSLIKFLNYEFYHDTDRWPSIETSEMRKFMDDEIFKPIFKEYGFDF